MRFETYMALRVGDTLTVLLRGFSSMSPACFPVSSSEGNVFSAATWDPRAETLTFPVVGPLPPRTSVLLVVPASAGISLPPDGVAANFSGLVLSATAVEGSAYPEAFGNSPAVGTVRASLDYQQLPDASDVARVTLTLSMVQTGPHANSTLALTLAFAAALSAGDVVRVAVSGVRAVNFENASVTSEPVGAITAASLRLDGTELWFLVSLDVPANTPVTLWLDSADLTPATSTAVVTNSSGDARPEQAAVGLFADASAPALSFDQFCESDGSFLSASLLTGGSMAVSGSGYHLRFLLRPASALNVNTTLNLSLPAFATITPPSAAGASVDSSGAGRFTFLASNVSWITFNVTSPVAANALVAIHLVARSAALVSPATKVAAAANETGIMSAAAFAAGPSSAVSFSAPILLFTNGVSANLTASHSRAGDSITLRVSTSMPMAAGESFEVSLPTFLGEDAACLRHLSPASGVFSAARWSNEGSNRSNVGGSNRETGRLTLVVGPSGMLPGTVGAFSIPYVAGITLPLTGLLANWTSLTVATTALAGPVLPTVLISPFVNGSNVPDAPPILVGGFTGELSLSFDPPKAGEPTVITLRFTPTMSLREYESVRVYLPDFSGPELEGVGAVGGATGARFTASWSQLCPARTLTFTLGAGQAVAAGEAVEVAVPASSLIRVPPNGIRELSGNFTISSDAVDGPEYNLL
ncbi:hypothetical protein T484DRAFT_1878787, partial [Baffinella frigidus]